MSKLLLILLLPLNMFAQEFIASGELDNKIAEGITIVEFWAEWNKSNECVYLSQLNGCQVYKVNVLKCSNIQRKYKVFSLPTLIIFENGKEITRFVADITFKLSIDKKGVQREIDKLTFNRAQ